ncbi:unnamed protein product [Gadus morhua 'NCC']
MPSPRAMSALAAHPARPPRRARSALFGVRRHSAGAGEQQSDSGDAAGDKEGRHLSVFSEPGRGLAARAVARTEVRCAPEQLAPDAAHLPGVEALTPTPKVQQDHNVPRCCWQGSPKCQPGVTNPGPQQWRDVVEGRCPGSGQGARNMPG